MNTRLLVYRDPSVPNNYRPISNLSFVSKLLERVVARQLTTHLESNGLIPALQSAYRRNHSTETALLKICNDALMAADNGMVTLVVLLDYSAAFDTVDHSIMLDILERRCGLTDDALRWRTSYLHSRSSLAVIRLKLLTSAAVYHRGPVLARLSSSSTLQIFML